MGASLAMALLLAAPSCGFSPHKVPRHAARSWLHSTPPAQEPEVVSGPGQGAGGQPAADWKWSHEAVEAGLAEVETAVESLAGFAGGGLLAPSTSLARRQSVEALSTALLRSLDRSSEASGMLSEELTTIAGVLEKEASEEEGRLASLGELVARLGQVIDEKATVVKRETVLLTKLQDLKQETLERVISDRLGEAAVAKAELISIEMVLSETMVACKAQLEVEIMMASERLERMQAAQKNLPAASDKEGVRKYGFQVERERCTGGGSLISDAHLACLAPLGPPSLPFADSSLQPTKVQVAKNPLVPHPALPGLGGSAGYDAQGPAGGAGQRGDDRRPPEEDHYRHAAAERATQLPVQGAARGGGRGGGRGQDGTGGGAGAGSSAEGGGGRPSQQTGSRWGGGERPLVRGCLEG